MALKEVFEGIESFFVEVAFAPLDALRALELSDWWSANAINWLFMFICMGALTYWMLQLKKFNDNNEEDRSSISHSFLGKDGEV